MVHYDKCPHPAEAMGRPQGNQTSSYAQCEACGTRWKIRYLTPDDLAQEAPSAAPSGDGPGHGVKRERDEAEIPDQDRAEGHDERRARHEETNTVEMDNLENVLLSLNDTR